MAVPARRGLDGHGIASPVTGHTPELWLSRKKPLEASPLHTIHFIFLIFQLFERQHETFPSARSLAGWPQCPLRRSWGSVRLS